MKNLTFANNEKILVIAPHPDDESIGCGGLLLKYASQCTILVLTDGCLGNPEWDEDKTRKVRKREFIKAMEYAGVKNYFFLETRDGSLRQCPDVFRTVPLSDYDYILCPNSHEDHSDHRAVYHLLQKARDFNPKKIIFYEVWTPIRKPSYYVDISDVVKKKKKLISFYKSQLKHVDYDSRILGLNCYRGLYPNVSYAEAYALAK